MDAQDPAARRYVLPECHAVARAKFSLDSDSHPGRATRTNPVYANVRAHAHLHGASVASVQRLAGQPYAALVQHDRQLLWRLHYRNRNQHRSGVHFRRLQALRRVLRAWDAAGPHALVRGLAQQCLAAAAAAAAGNRTADARWEALPCAVHVRALAARLAEVVRLAGVARDTCRAVFGHFTALVRQTLFMPLALVVVGVAARLHVVFGVWRSDLVDVYGVLHAWLPGLPACPESLAGGARELLLPPPPLLVEPDVLAGELSRAEGKPSAARDALAIRACAAESVRSGGDDTLDAVGAVDTRDSLDSLDSLGPPLPAASARRRRARDMFLDLFD
ncbi:hypothetical protein LPJ53_003883 [Coemansia erecta]|uniref:Nucleolus and neural progenitor protein-like N-terminal domain-containing protein n=1 Tax=Coemansia erecta TaxID=147472 RepID=A0A9W7Y123_9FUNG|nr:hypothetical protein LPJ53_003883 [Coemansia erecta]